MFTLRASWSCGLYFIKFDETPASYCDCKNRLALTCIQARRSVRAFHPRSGCVIYLSLTHIVRNRARIGNAQCEYQFNREAFQRSPLTNRIGSSEIFLCPLFTIKDGAVRRNSIRVFARSGNAFAHEPRGPLSAFIFSEPTTEEVMKSRRCC
jgi:hypothetical protein